MPTKIVRRMNRPGENPVHESDRRIESAVATLSSTERGRQVLKDLARVINGPASGLDSIGLSAVQSLVREFTMNHRRGFLEAYKTPKIDLTSVHMIAAEFGFKCAEKGMNLEATMDKLSDIISEAKK